MLTQKTNLAIAAQSIDTEQTTTTGRKRKRTGKGNATNAVKENDATCAMHENLFARVAFHFGRLTVEEQLKLLEYAWGFIHPRHLVRLILDEMYTQRTRPRNAKTRNAHKLVNSSAERSIEVVYGEWLDFLQSHRYQCSLMEKRENDQLWHVDNGVATNYTRGFDGYRNAEEQKFNRHAKNVKIVTPEQNTMNSIEPVYTVNVFAFLGNLSVEWQDAVVEQEQQQRHNRADETSSEYRFVETFLKNSVHARAMKLLDFTFANGDECWALWNQILDRCLTVYQHVGFFPVKDSVYDVTVVVTEEDNSGSVYTVPSHGALTKLGNFVDFSQSFRILMQMSVLNCCYVSPKRGPSDRLNYTKQHTCVFPAASQHAYNEIFLTSKFGHDLLCNLSMQNTEECLWWLKTFGQTRAEISRVRSLRVSDKLEQFFDEFGES